MVDLVVSTLENESQLLVFKMAPSVVKTYTTHG
jgi:hypothetical protein